MKHKVRWGLLSLAGLLLIAMMASYSLAPALFSQGLHNWAERQGYDRSEHGMLKIHPFKGAFSAKNLQLVRNGRTVLSAANAEIKISLAALLRGRLTVDLVKLSGAHLHIQREKGKEIIVGGLTMNGANDSGTDISIKLINVLDAELTVRLPGFESIINVKNLRIDNSNNISVERIQLENLQANISRNDAESWNISGNGSALQGSFKLGNSGNRSDTKTTSLLADLSLRVDTIEVTGNSSIHYRDKILDVTIDENIIIDEARLTGIDSSRPEQAMQFIVRKHNPNGGSSTWQGEAYLFKEDPVISLQGRIESTKETLMSKIAAKSLGLEISRGKAIVEIQVGIFQDRINGTLSLQTTDLLFLSDGKEVLGMKKGDIQVSLAELLKGELEIKSASLEGTQLTIEQLNNGTTKIAGITLASMETGHQKPGRKRYPIESLNISNGQLELLAPGLQLAMHVNQLQISKGKTITADVISLPDLKIDVVHAGTDDWKLIGENNGRRVEYGFGSKGYDSDTNNNLLQGLDFKINQIKLSGDSTLRYEDTSSGTPVIWDLNFNKASINTIDSTRPDSSSTIVISMTSDEYEQFELQGSSKLFATVPELYLKGHAEAVKLTPLTPLTEARYGFRIDSGQVDADVKLKVADNKIDGRIDLNINLLRVSATDTDKLKPFEASLYEGLKLPQMVRLLTDKHGVMPIGLPISGDPRAPSFDLDINMEVAFNKAVSSVAGVVIAPVLTSIIREAKTRRKRLAAISFSSGSDELNNKAERMITRAAKKLNENPERLVTICGTAGEHELAPLKLARNRAEQVRLRLIKEHGIEPKRLIACLPAIKTYEPVEDDYGLLSETRPVKDLYVDIR